LADLISALNTLTKGELKMSERENKKDNDQNALVDLPVTDEQAEQARGGHKSGSVVYLNGTRQRELLTHN
jgi:hypothetical protein